ncbi:MAG: DMT family transporter [Spirochaetes bacterium]|nr:DMT family transporter [Spirochaetota bacterium]
MNSKLPARPGLATELAFESLLLITAVIWGLGFVAQRIGLEDLPPFAFNAARFALGALSLVPVILLRRTSRARLRACLVPALIAGVVLTLAASLQQLGMQYTSAGKGGFITGLYVVLVPIAGIALGRKTAANTWLGVVLTFAGLFLLSVTENFSINKGDLLVLLGAFFWAAHILVLDRFAPKVDPIVLAALQFLVCALLTGTTAFVFETPTAAGFSGAFPAIAFSGLLTIGLGFTLQAIAQTKAHPARASIIMSLEAMFAAIGGWIILGERLSPRELAGCAIMLSGMIVAQLPPVRRRLLKQPA